ncbi:sensor histidine kinase [Spirosoma oryzicola]|uniref:sensor histidine kinase n=1 Tax=Spirosoma oryzicola TaxID=2898794 RepID=UPI001E2AA4D1|nr:histidine kinase [Spirosoma oryzicola]UHG89167.1 histidine kinase [Spirosoma oryzicola]
MHSSVRHTIRQWLSQRLLIPRFGAKPDASVTEAQRALPGKQPALRWHVLLMPVFFIPLVSYWIIGPTYLSDWRAFVGGTVLNFTLTGCCVSVLNYLTPRVIQRYPSLTQVWSRVWRMLLIFGFVTPAFLLLGIFIYEHFHLFGYQHEPGLTTKILLYNALVNVISVGIDETVYSLTKWRESLLEQEKLKEVTLQSQYESLKHQVNPHFLFNSLNSLSSLIADEPEQAEEFLYEMANVYRYLLQTNKAVSTEGGSELTTLETELKFIDSYYHLLKTRYRAGIDLQIDVSADLLTHRLPPLTLQMLVENAVKHNVVAANKPLLLEISTTTLALDRMDQTPIRQICRPGKASEGMGWLIVRNNLQRKNNRMASNQVGLSNIAAKYRLLAQSEPIIRDDDGYFTVMLSLFSPEKS